MSTTEGARWRAPARLARRRGISSAPAGPAVAGILLAARWTPYLETEMLGLPGLIAPGSVCVDVGAAAGLYTLALSRLAGPAGQVHAVEPLSFAHPAWARLLRTAEAGNVRRHQVALGPEAGHGVMSVPLGRFGPVTGRSFLAARSTGLGSNAEFGAQMAVSVPVQTLDQLCEAQSLTQLDFVKIDVEGAEFGVLEGGASVIEKHTPALLVEIEARHASRFRCRPPDITSWLTGRGYTMHTWQRSAGAGGWHPATAVTPHTRNYLFTVPGWRPGR